MSAQAGGLAHFGPPPAVAVRALVTGSRTWAEYDMVYQALERLLARYERENLLVMHGDAPDGADHYAKIACRGLGIYAPPVPAMWRLGRSIAGRERNDVMVRVFEPHLGLVFMRRPTPGTSDCLERLERHSVPVWKFPEDAATFDGGIRRAS